MCIGIGVGIGETSFGATFMHLGMGLGIGIGEASFGATFMHLGMGYLGLS